MKTKDEMKRMQTFQAEYFPNVLRGSKGGSMREIIVVNSSPKARVSFIYIKISMASSIVSVIFLCSFSTLYFRSTCRLRCV